MAITHRSLINYSDNVRTFTEYDPHRSEDAEVVQKWTGTQWKTLKTFGHMRDDYPDRNDAEYMQHTMAYLTGDAHSADASDHIRMDWKPVVITHYQPMERKY